MHLSIELYGQIFAYPAYFCYFWTLNMNAYVAAGFYFRPSISKNWLSLTLNGPLGPFARSTHTCRSIHLQTRRTISPLVVLGVGQAPSGGNHG